jgi:predicted dehydrogenase
MQREYSKDLRLGVVGYGYWSPKVISGFKNANGAQVFAICEKDEAKWDVIRSQIPEVKIYKRFEELLQDKEIDAIVITTTVSSHYRIAKAALESDKHVLVEKPMTEYVWQADHLIDLSIKKGLVLMVDHTFLFMPAIRALKQLIDQDELGKVHAVLGNRSNLGLFQKDVDVLYDLAPHDFSILYYLFKEEPKQICVSGHSPIKHKLQKRFYNAISVTSLKYKSGLFVNFIHSWLTPIKDRRMIFIGDKKMAVFDMLDKEGQLKVYDTKVDFIHDANVYGNWFNYTNNNYRVVDLENLGGDDLQRMAQEFIDCINQKRRPVTDGELGKTVVRTLERIQNLGERNYQRYWRIFKNKLNSSWS